MKKSKIIIPALGVLVLSTAASITGTVAWFTANRAATVTAGTFVAVNTNDNLNVSLAAGCGTTADGTNVSTGSNKLTDASLNHTVTAANIVTPNVAKDKVARLDSAYDAKATLESNLLRGLNTYSAFTWEMTFSVTFSSSADKNIGLFLDTDSTDTGVSIPHSIANGASQAGYYDNPKCEGDALAGTASEAKTVYEKVTTNANDCGQAFRIAFLPKTIVNQAASDDSSMFAKVWAPNRAAANCNFVTAAASAAITGVAGYGTQNTIKKVGSAAVATSTSDVTSGKVLIDNTSDSGIPVDGTTSKSAALEMENYLGFLKADPGHTASLTFVCVAWFEGTDTSVSNTTNVFPVVSASMRFGVTNLSD